MNKQYMKRASEFQVNSETEDKMTVAGYFAVFDQETQIVEKVTEQIARGAFSKSLMNNDIKVLFGHDDNKLLARSGNGTARFLEDDYGLYVEVDLPNTTLGRDTYELVRNKTLCKCSIGFFADKVKHENRQRAEHFTIEEANLLEVSFVTFPAYEGTSVEARSKGDETEMLNKIKERKLACLKDI